MRATLTERVPRVSIDKDTTARSWPAARSLARIEGRHLLRSPLVLAGLAFALLPGLGTGLWVPELRASSADSAFMFLMLAAGTLVATNLATLRSRRHGTEELLGTTPSPPTVRTGAHLLSVAGPVVMAVVVVAVSLASDLLRRQAYGRPDLAELAVGPLLVAGAGALGVLLARWMPSALVAPVACVAIAAFELFMNSSALVVATGWRWLGFWLQAGDIDLMPPRPARWHLVYLGGLITLAAVGAVARHGQGRPVVVAGSVAVAVTAVAAAAQMRPVSSETWAARNAMLSNPGASQVCEERAEVRYCAFPADAPLVTRWAEVVAGVRANVPPAAWPGGLAVTQRFTPGDLQYTPQKLREVLPDLPAPGTPLPDDGDVHPGSTWTTDGATALSLGVGVASRVVGLPLAPPAPATLCDAAGQGRAIVALWLGGRATPDAASALRRAAPPDVVDLEGRPYLVQVETSVQQAVAWGAVEVHHARALLTRPVPEVVTALARHWDRLTDPATTTAEAATLLGLPAVPAGAVDSARPSELRLGPPCGRTG